MVLSLNGPIQHIHAPHIIPIHKHPAAHHTDNACFNKCVSHIKIQSEHCIGILKRCLQCLHGLFVQINSKYEHVAACWWSGGDGWGGFWWVKYNGEEFDSAAGGLQVLPSVMTNDNKGVIYAE